MRYYDGKKVFTTPNYRVTDSDLTKCKSGYGQIQDAYFCQIAENGFMEKKDFNKTAIEEGRSALNLSIDGPAFGADIQIAGLERITAFLSDSNSLGNIGSLKGKEVTQYFDFVKGLQGISLE